MHLCQQGDCLASLFHEHGSEISDTIRQNLASTVNLKARREGGHEHRASLALTREAKTGKSLAPPLMRA
eukprot:766454-Hanusia_phi.AAC.17